jgi:hypothetical protein
VLVVGAGAGGWLTVGVGVSVGVRLGVVGVLGLVLTLGAGDGVTLRVGLGEVAGVTVLLLFNSMTKITMPAAISKAATTIAAMSGPLSRPPGGSDASSTSAAGEAIGT